MAISLLQIDAAEVTPKDDAILYNHLVGESGILSGCAVTSLGGNQLQIDAGRGIIMGRVFVVTQQTINAMVSTSGTKLGRLLVQIDTSNPTTPISFVTQMAAALPELTCEDINGSGSVYELPLSIYNISETTISNLESVSTDISGIKPHLHEIDDVEGLQSAISGKQNIINVTAGKALISDVTGAVAASSVTATEIGYVSGVTGAIQAQIDAKLAANKIKVSATEPIDLSVGDFWFKDLGLIS